MCVWVGVWVCIQNRKVQNSLRSKKGRNIKNPLTTSDIKWAILSVHGKIRQVHLATSLDCQPAKSRLNQCVQCERAVIQFWPNFGTFVSTIPVHWETAS
jgi:hypothetical protein